IENNWFSFGTKIRYILDDIKNYFMTDIDVFLEEDVSIGHCSFGEFAPLSFAGGINCNNYYTSYYDRIKMRENDTNNKNIKNNKSNKYQMTSQSISELDANTDADADVDSDYIKITIHDNHPYEEEELLEIYSSLNSIRIDSITDSTIYSITDLTI